MRAKIYQPARNAMQSGTAKSRDWVLEFVPQAPKKRDPLMGWSGSKGTLSQLKMKFETLDEAKKYAENEHLEYDVIISNARQRKPNIRKLGYAENFVPGRRLPWTH